MSKATLGLLALCFAAVNLYWGAKIHSLMRAPGTTEERAAFAARAKRLVHLSRISALVFFAMFLVYLWLQR